MPEHSDPSWQALATLALEAAIDEDWDTAVTAIGRINDERKLTEAMFVFIDTYLEQEGVPPGTEMSLEIADLVDPDVPVSEDRLPASTAWAANMITARASRDEPRAWDLLMGIPEGEDGLYMLAVINIVASSLATARQKPPLDPAWRLLTDKALSAAIAGDWEVATILVHIATRKCGHGALKRVVLHLCDTLIASCMPDRNSAVEAHLVFHSHRTGTDAAADTMPAPTVWAGRLVAARACRDMAMWQALMDAVPDRDLNIHVFALLNDAATTIRTGVRWTTTTKESQ